MYVRNKFSQHYYFSICWLSFTNQFLNQLQSLMITFLCLFDYPNNLFKRTPSVAISADNRCLTVKNLITIRPAGAELFHEDRRKDRRKDGHRDISKLIDAFCN